MIRFLFAFFCLFGIAGPGNALQRDPVDYVNTLQGTNSDFTLTRGNTYPTVALPFAMHTWSAQTGENGSGWKYQYACDSIRGFQQAHQCSSWTNDYYVYSLMPVAGELRVDQYGRAAKFSHKAETGRPYLYSVDFDNGIRAEVAPVERGAHLRFRFPKGERAYVVLDGYTGMSGVAIDPSGRRITGYVSNGDIARRLGSKCWFVVEFDAPIRAFGTWDNTSGATVAGRLADDGKGKGAYVEFAPGATVSVKTASSYISAAQAEQNLASELGFHKHFEQTRDAARKIWNDHLSRILVEDDDEELIATFYSCFFRASIFSRKYYELDAAGNPYYRSPNDNEIHTGYYYTDTGFWDTFRAQFPLSCILHPTMQGRYMQAMLACKREYGWLPSWSFPNEAGSMIGNHAISLFADAWAKGIRTFDPAEALAAYYEEATEDGPSGPASGRKGWKEYFTLGYIPYPDMREATAKTLEYAYDDWCAYELARRTGNDYYRTIFGRQMYNYRNVFDPARGFMRGRLRNGSWVEPFDPTEWGGPFTEGCAWHYLWSVFHDPAGLSALLGGDEAFAAKMDSVFTISSDFKVGTYGSVIHEMAEMKMADMGQYAHGNQPIQHMVYLYNHAGRPWKAQQRAREVMTRLYSWSEDGYPGDEDQGQTSSWYVLSALGLYSVCPGTDQYVMGSPLFRRATVTMEDGRKFVIKAEGNSREAVYIDGATLNGEPLSRTYLTYDEIVAGGELCLQMSVRPNTGRGTRVQDRPYSVSLVADTE
ncbi:MAG: GH92 family glycosyl hydrolase [Rikenellaceae bacterium]|nr:GH92 family glycosyl hydrolase [Rikenellaceae bacterium]